MTIAGSALKPMYPRSQMQGPSRANYYELNDNDIAFHPGSGVGITRKLQDHDRNPLASLLTNSDVGEKKDNPKKERA